MNYKHDTTAQAMLTLLRAVESAMIADDKGRWIKPDKEQWVNIVEAAKAARREVMQS